MIHSRHVLVAAVFFLVSAGATRPGATAPPQQTATAPSSSEHELLARYCITCHNTRLRTAGLALDALNLTHVGDDAETWEKVVRKLRSGAMPPGGRPQPDKPARDAFVAWLEDGLDAAARAHPDPGRPATLHRLNRAEYKNAVRDLLSLDVDVSSLLPSDPASYGFDNIGDVLGMPPVLLERYLAAARTISRLAVGDTTLPPATETYRVPSDLTQDDRLDGLPLGTRGGKLIRHHFPLDGEYHITIRLARDSVDNVLLGVAEPHQIEVRIDGERVSLFTVGEKRLSRAALMLENADAGLDVAVPVKAGLRAVSVAFLKEPSTEVDKVRQPFLRASPENGDTHGFPYLRTVTISGPLNVTGPGDTPSRRRIFACRPVTPAEESQCARQILSSMGRRAYRRPLTEADIQDLLGFYAAGRAAGGFDRGIQQAVRRILINPDFLFRIEQDPPNTPPKTSYRIGDVALASRLSFFLWSSIPDDELLNLGERGQLSDPAVLDSQVRRMLADSRSDAFVSNFAGQWLFLRNVPAARPDPRLFPDFDENLRTAFRRETELFFESVVRENRSALDLLTANYTFLNERLARHYQIAGVYGDHFRRVALPDDARSGLLGQGSILTVTWYSNRTSPVLRGVWILENVLGAAPPPPPANVPPLAEREGGQQALSMRERMAQHRTNPSCASCHSLMDPLGLALENFDAVGRWRSADVSNAPLDVSGVLPDGTTFDGVAGLRQALLSHSAEFLETVTEKLLIYALGRGLESYDRPTVRQIIRGARSSEYGLASLIAGVVKSPAFLNKRSAEAPAESAAANR